MTLALLFPAPFVLIGLAVAIVNALEYRAEQRVAGGVR